MHKQPTNPADPMFRTADGSTTIFDKFSYSAAVRAGDFVYAAGQIGLNPDGSIPTEADQQIVNAFDRLSLVLKSAGSSLDDVVELVSYHVGLQAHFSRFVEIKNRYVKAPFPAWTTIDVAGLARQDLVIEIKAVAYSPNGRR